MNPKRPVTKTRLLTLSFIVTSDRMEEIPSYQTESSAHSKSTEKRLVITHSRRKMDEKILNVAKEHIEKSYSSRLTTPKLARHVGVNDCRLKTIFREYQGTGIAGYLRKVRMEQAKDMLVRQGRRIEDVYPVVGYSNQPNFTKAFKKYFGITPGAMVKNVGN